MLREYDAGVYRPAAAAFEARARDGARLAGDLRAWEERLARRWGALRFGGLDAAKDGPRLVVEVSLSLGELSSEDLRVELYAEAAEGVDAQRVPMALVGPPGTGERR